MLKKVFLAAAILSLMVLAAHPWPASEVRATTLELPEPPMSAQATETNVLPNAKFDQGFYWRPTNHYVANMWYEWWVGGQIPEFIDGGHPYHNACYPKPASGVCANAENHSQGYIRWGAPFVAGVYQPVSVATCTTYRFTAYNRNDDWNYHPKIGIDPTGWRPGGLHEGTANNCPPDGQSPCPNPSLDQNNPFPSTLIWSPEFDHEPYSWASQSLTVEARSSTITVWTYAAPTTPGSMSAYWDYASLVQVPPANGKLIADGALPAADGSITSVTTQTTALRATLGWKTSQPAVTQVLYHYVGSSTITPTPPIENQVANYELSTSIDYIATTDHQVRLPDLRPMSLYDYVILARRLVGSSCQTAVLTGRLSTTDSLVPSGALPAPSSDIIGMTILPFEHSAYVIWQSAQPSYSQVLYHYSGPITPTIPSTLTQKVFLPVVFSGPTSGSTTDYEFRTAPITMSATLHIIQLTGLQTDSLYTAIGVSAWVEGDQDQVAVSALTGFRTGAIPTLMTAEPSPAQLAERLQACLADGKSLDACVSELKQK